MIKYYPYDTVIHRLSPMLKIVVMLSIMLSSIVFLNLYLQVALFLIVLLFIFIAKLPLKEVAKFAWFFIILAPTTLLFHAVFHHLPDYVVFEVLGIKAYHSGIMFGMIITFRLLTLGFLAPLVLMTTRISDLIKSAGKYLPKYIVFGLALAFRFIPIFEEEINRIIMSKEARATRKRDLNYLTSMLIPLFSKALKRSRTMSYSLESRGFST